MPPSGGGPLGGIAALLDGGQERLRCFLGELLRALASQVFANLLAHLVERFRRRQVVRGDAQHQHVVVGELDELAVAAAVDDFIGEGSLDDGGAVRERVRVAAARETHAAS